MKKIYKSVLVVLAAATLTSCGNSWLDESPSNGADTEVAIDNYAKALNALYGVYDGLQGSSSRNEYYGARMLYYGDVRADDMQSSTGTRTVPLYEMRYTASNAPGIWDIPYNVIRRANSLLDAIEKGKVADGKEADLADMKGQCLTVRALAHSTCVVSTVSLTKWIMEHHTVCQLLQSRLILMKEKACIQAVTL